MKTFILGLITTIVVSQMLAVIPDRNIDAVETRGSVQTMAKLATYIGSGDPKLGPGSASRKELMASAVERPDYIVVGIRPIKSSHISGVLAVKIDGRILFKLPVTAHRGPHWVEYFIPRDSDAGWVGDLAVSPRVELEWIELIVK